jgi:3-oxoacyl-[acyl-carrier-protein] synthase-3
MNIKITGTGSCIPNVNKKNEDFLTSNFLNTNGNAFKQNNDVIIQKFKAITGIEERRYAEPNQVTSDLGFIAAEKAIIAANINPETLDYIIVASNYGDVKSGNIQCDTVPSMASRIKHKLGIKNPNCVAYDLLFGCPGWVQAIIHASAFMKSGMSKKCLVIGAETLSRVVDDYDRDSMIYSDGAGATILEISDNEKGILSHESASYIQRI